ncbi:hypothetical protein H0E84_05945 [Luteimonas sp. SJ-92]|uniref:Uncharacterized protein n=1 Tax=Luteimonas salinisoli TaxID=2752307 RepID=A0A853JBD1_9GAMM|nr:hypothetical protein [Luteimonas salinisoli]NZA25920.1 hypothetical protein [Luteimonas salinisoli]
MNIPLDTPITIVAYRDFYDVPRLILACDQNANFWILDSAFDESVDEYSSSFEVFFVGHDPSIESLTLDYWPSRPRALSVGNIAVDQIKFDATRRKDLIRESPVGLGQGTIE